MTRNRVRSGWLAGRPGPQGPCSQGGLNMKAGIQYSYILPTHYMIVAQCSMQYTDYACKCNRKKHNTDACGIIKQRYGILYPTQRKRARHKACYDAFRIGYQLIWGVLGKIIKDSSDKAEAKAKATDSSNMF